MAEVKTLCARSFMRTFYSCFSVRFQLISKPLIEFLWKSRRACKNDNETIHRWMLSKWRIKIKLGDFICLNFLFYFSFLLFMYLLIDLTNSIVPLIAFLPQISKDQFGSRKRKLVLVNYHKTFPIKLSFFLPSRQKKTVISNEKVAIPYSYVLNENPCIWCHTIATSVNSI